MLLSAILQQVKNAMNLNVSVLTQQLNHGASQLGLALQPPQQQALLNYLQLLVKWNKAYNLTAIREPERMVSLHLLDSLAVHPHIQQAQRILDVGTGAGLPGVVLAIMNPHKHFVLLDSNGKKTRFLTQVKVELGLENLTVENARVEAYQDEQGFDMITSRAFASLADMVHWCAHLLAKQGCFMAMKGQYPQEEIEVIAEHYQVVTSLPLQIPGVEGERHLLHIEPK